jgi:hypothetical protein
MLCSLTFRPFILFLSATDFIPPTISDNISYVLGLINITLNTGVKPESAPGKLISYYNAE